MSYRVDCATKEEWAARCFGAEYRLATAQARIEELEDYVSELLVNLPCGCGQDNPTDICMVHMPAFRKQQDKINELEAALIGVLPYVNTSREAAELAAMERQCTPALDAVAAANKALKDTTNE